jgi:hypothetical protein
MTIDTGGTAGGLGLVNECKGNPPSCHIAKKKSAPPRKRRYDRFLCGPVPLVWLSMAAKLSGKALHVGIALWYLAGVTKSFTVKLTRSTLTLFGVSRWSVSRNLRLLELAGLVTVERRKGKVPLVTIVEEPRSLLEINEQDGGESDA